MTMKNAKFINLIASGALIAAGAPAVQALAATSDASGADADRADANLNEESCSAAAQREIADVQGSFSWNQDASASNEMLRRLLYDASKNLCGSRGLDIGLDASSGAIDAIRVTGDVENPLVADVDAYRKKAPVKQVMSCTCAGNPADGRASANAQVEGFRLSALIEDAVPSEGVNTITFVSADGMSVLLPLSYVRQRYSIIVTTVNDEDATSAIGCSNQLWLGSTAARLFSQNIVEIRLTAEENPPAAPGAQGANQPNVAVTFGSAA